MPFDYEGAKEAGFTDQEIAEHLAPKNNFDLSGAVSAGFGYEEIVPHLLEKAGTPTPETTAFGQVGETLKAIPRGFARSLLTAGEGAGELADAVTNKIGLENLIDSGDDNALVAAARQGQKALNESWLGVDDAYQDAWMTKFGEGLGSMASFLTPGGALKLAGIGSRAAQLGATATLAAPVTAGEQVQRVEQARAEGIDVSEAQEDAAVLFGAAIGLTELAPVDRLLRGLDPSKLSDDLKVNIMQRLGSALGSGGVEALQETSASLMQDLAEREIYNPDLQLGQEAWDSFTVGGAVGFTADLVLNAMGVRRNNTKTETQIDKEKAERVTEQQNAEARRAQFDRAPEVDVSRIRSEMQASGDPAVVAAEPQLSDDQIREMGGQRVAPVEEELDPATISPKSDNMGAYAKDIAIQMGNNFPTETSFNIEPISIPVDETTTEPAFQVVDSQGKAYGSPRLEYEEAAVLAGTLNEEIVNQTARNSVNEVIESTPEQYDEPVIETLEVIGNRIKNPRSNEITVDALNMAAETTVDKGFEETLSAEQAMQRNMGKVFTESEMVNSLTAAQQANRKRLAQGLPETNTFTVEEARDVLGDKFGRLGDIGVGGILETQRYTVGKTAKGKPAVISSVGEVITSKRVEKLRKRDGKPYTQKRVLKTEREAQILADRLNSRYDKAIDEVVFEDIKTGNEEIKALLERKNIPNELDSPAIQTMAKAFVGKENVNDMDAGEKKFFYQKIRKLPFVPSPLKEGLPDFDQAPTLTQSTEVDAEPLALPSPDRELPSPELVADMQERLDAELKRKNLATQKVTGRIFQEFREYGLNKEDQPVFTSEVVEDVEGGYLKNFNEIAVGVRQALQFHENRTGAKVDMNDPDAVFAVIKDVLNHETVHALRRLDLFTEQEYRVLERAAQNTNRKGENITYLDEAKVRYSDLSKTQIMEEAIAELVRQNTTLGGRPRTIINKIKDILEAIARWISASPPSVQRIVEDIESGVIGGRQAGEIRTLRKTRELADRYESELMLDEQKARLGDTFEEMQAQLNEAAAQLEEAEVAHSRLNLSDKINVAVDRVVSLLGGKLKKADVKKAVMDFRETLPEQKGSIKPRNSFDNIFNTLNAAQLSQRENLNHKDVIKRVPDITVATILFKDGLISKKQRDRVVDATKPVTPYESLPSSLLTSQDEAIEALDDTVIRKYGLTKKEMFGKTQKHIKDEGLEYVALRLDIPAYSGSGAWVVAVHNPRGAEQREAAGGRGAFEGKAGTPVGYELAMSVDDVSFGIGKERDFTKMAAGVAAGAASKNTFATIEGKPQEKSYGALLREARKILKDMREGKQTNWRQVGYDPERHTYFYDRANGQPIVSADRVIQIGPLVLAENANTTQEGETIDAQAYLDTQDIAFSRRSPLVNILEEENVRLDKEGAIQFGTPRYNDQGEMVEKNHLTKRMSERAIKPQKMAQALKLVLQGKGEAFRETKLPGAGGKGGIIVRANNLEMLTRVRPNPDRSKGGMQWVIETAYFIDPAISYSRVARNKEGKPLGINVAVDRDGTDYADLIVNGSKTYESRESTSLNPYIGKRVGIVRTGAGPAEVIGSVEIGEPVEVGVAEFNELRSEHLVPEGSRFDIKSGQTKYLYPMIDPSPSDPQRVTASGIVSRVIPEQEISYSRRQGITIPEASSPAPTLPLGEVETELQALLDRTNGNPTSQELSEIPGAPKKRMIKNKKGERVPDLVRDGEVKPTSLSRLRQMARKGLREGVGDLNWYDQFGQGLVDIVGEANIDEASVIFGITSGQSPAEMNLSDTLHIMSVAREFDPVTNTSKFIQAVRVKPDGRKLFISGPQINRIVRMYNEGMAEGGLKTTTYMQLIQDRARNVFNPFSVQDVHMSRVFGFRRKGYNDKGELIDASVIPGDLQYRYAQYLTSYLAKEFGVTPNQMQAALWFVGKKNLSDKVTKPGEGTWKSAARYSAPEIKRIEKQVEDGLFDKNTPLTPALEKGIRPKNAPKVKENAYTNHLQIADLRELAAQRAPRVVASANPGNARGYGFPDSVSFEDLISFNEGAIDVITDEKGQIPFIRQLGIDHVVESSFGSYEGVEPGIQVRLLDANLKQANFIAQVLGDGLLQDAVLTSEPNINSNDRIGIALTKADGSKFTQEEIMAIAAKANPENDPYGLNFTAYNDNHTIAFLDGRTFDRESLPEYTDEMALEFNDKVVSAFDSDVEYVYTPYKETGEYYESERYLSSPRERAGLERSVTGSSDILSIANDTLYKPFWDYYTAEAERIGFTPQNLTPPVPPLLPDIVRPEFPIPREIPPLEVEAAVEKNLEALENTTGGAVPTFSVKASPDAQAVARNPDLAAKLSADQEIFYSRRRPSDPEVRAAVDKVIQPDYGNKGILHNLLSFMSPSTKKEYKSKFSWFRQGFINRYEPLEKMSQMMAEKLDTLADSSAFFAMIMGDRASNQTAGSIKYGVTGYDAKNGIFKVNDFVYQGKKVDGLLGVLKSLFPSENVYGENLLEVWQSYAIAKRAKEINASGKLSPVPKGEEDAYLAEMEAMADKYINPETGQSYIREVYDMYQAYNNEVIKLMKDSGLITEAEATKWERSSVYYPFYKDFDADPNAETNQEGSDGKLVNVDSILNVGMENSPSFLPQEKIGSKKLRKLEGSRLKIDVPPLEALVKNLDAAITMSMKNIAYQRAMRDAVYLGFASKIEKGRKMRALKKGEINNSVYIRENGKDVHYKVHDQLLFAALTPIADGSLVSNVTMVTSIPARFLRESVTRAPGFMGVNMLRDTLSAYVTSGAKFTPIVDTAKNFAMSTQEFEEFEKLGIITGYDNLGDPKNLSAFLTKQMRKKGIDTGASRGRKAWENSLGWAWDKLGAGTTRSDFATRKSVYEDTLARTGNQAEAMHQAIEVLNFGRRGGNTLYRMIAAATPFLNARIQGLDVLWRTGLGTYSSRSDLGKAQIRRNAFLRASYLTALTAFYWLVVSDDDQYKEAADYVKDNNWLIPNPFGPQPIKIPIPFEIGLLFKTFPEKALDATFKDATARDFEQTVERGVLSTLEMNPLGMFQITAPIVEIAVNKNFYTGRQVVPYYIDQGVVAGLQDTLTTTQFSEWLGQTTGMSPMKIDHFLNGYAGSLGALFLDTTDWILRTPSITGDFADSMPTMSLSDHPATRRFFARAEGTGLSEDFYEMNRYVQQAVQTLGKLEDEGRMEEYQRFLYGREHLIGLQKDFNSISRELSELREQKQAILRLDIHPDEKREQVDEIDRMVNETLQIVPELKEAVSLPLFGQMPFIGESTFKGDSP